MRRAEQRLKMKNLGHKSWSKQIICMSRIGPNEKNITVQQAKNVVKRALRALRALNE
jgi:hypothetical protein